MNYEINISESFDHKILYSQMPEDENEHGVAGLCIINDNYNKDNVKFNYNDLCFVCNGASADVDNIVCNNQHIYIKHKNIKSIFFLGFNEFGNYEDELIIVDDSNNKIKKKIFFYGFNQILDALYSVEMNDCCNIAVSTLANNYLNVNIYAFELKLEGTNVEEIILPDNPEMHIMAVSVTAD